MVSLTLRPAVAAALVSLLLAACSTAASPTGSEPPATASPTPTPSPDAASPSADPSVEPPAEPTPQPTPGAEWGWMAEYARYGSMATVVDDGLRVRLWPGLDGELVVTLPEGTELLMWNGAVAADDHQWYNVGFHDVVSERTPGGIGTGWVSGEFIEIGDPRCPETIDSGVLARMTDWALDSCIDEIPTLSGQIDTCIEGPISPFSYEPSWLSFSCIYLTGEGAELPIHFPPDYAGPEPERGDLVEVTGHLGIDTAEYGDCTVDTAEAELQDRLEVEHQSWAIRCLNRFVVDELTVTGHEDLPPRL